MATIYATEEDYNTDSEEEIEVVDKEDTVKKIVVYNDDFNTIEHVIYCLEKYCEHTTEKAIELTLEIHEKGSSVVKDGSAISLRPIRASLNENGLNAQIED